MSKQLLKLSNRLRKEKSDMFDVISFFPMLLVEQKFLYCGAQ